MALLHILKYPDERLRNVAKPVTEFDDELQTIVNDMLETMYEASGIGLAATQVNIAKQLFLMDLSEDHSEPYIIINPKIITSDGHREREEGCLSFPEVYAKVTRADSLTIEYHDVQGDVQTLSADGLMATCIQHEIDHLQGKLFVDYLSPLKRQRIRKKLEKNDRLQKRM